MSRVRDLTNMARGAGLEVLRTYQKHSSTYADVRAPNGVETSFFVLSNQGKGKDDLDCQTRMRRFARQNPAPAPVEKPESPAPRRTLTVKKEPTTTASSAEQDLTPKEFYRLCEWIKGTNMGPILSLEALALFATKHIGQPVSEGAVTEAMEATGTPRPEGWDKLPEPNVIMANELAALFKSLGHVPSRNFERMLATLQA
ncbi:hypothetical protein [Cupriavidus metallidurans]